MAKTKKLSPEVQKADELSEYDNYIQDTFGISNAHVETNEKFVSTDEGFIDFLEKRSRTKSTPKAQPAKQDKPPKAVAPVKAKPAGVPKKPKAKTYTVSGRTFATLAEAKAFKAL